MFKNRKFGFWLTFVAAVLALVAGICYFICYRMTADPVTGTIDRVFDTLTLGMMVGGALISLGGEVLRLRVMPIIATALYGVGLANHLVETAYPLADVLTKVPFFGGNPTLAIGFAVAFAVVAVLQVIGAFMEH